MALSREERLRRMAECARKRRAADPERQKQVARRCYLKNREKNLARQRAAYEKQRADPSAIEKQKAAARKSYRKHRERLLIGYRERALKWNHEHPERHKANVERWYAENRERALAKKAMWSAKNKERETQKRKAREAAKPEYYRAKRAAYNVSNKEKLAERYARWSAANLDKEAARAAKRRARKLQATPRWADLSAIQNLYANARLVSKALGVEFEVDHIVPLKGKNVCGLHCESNLQVITADANIRKGNKWA